MSNKFVMPVFNTVQEMAAYGRGSTELLALMARLHPGRRRFWSIKEGHISLPGVAGPPVTTSQYHTVAWGSLDNITPSNLSVGDTYTDVEGTVWEVVANTTSQGSASWPGTHTFCAVDVKR